MSFYIRYDVNDKPDALKALGVNNANWTEDGVIFYSERGEIKVDF
ncbi:hypothetical protein [Viridibacillus soli]|nr:hypothetical protein [Viridibacillus soli]